MNSISYLVAAHIRTVEMTAVIMRITSFMIISWLGSESPFLLVWFLNTIDAIVLTWTAIIKKDRAYTVLNFFWIIVGVVGMARALGIF